MNNETTRVSKKQTLKRPQPKHFKTKVTRWSHQNDLTQASNKKITLMHTNGEVTTGTLVDSDQFTLKITVAKSTDRAYSNMDVTQPITVLKHSLAAYQVESK